MLEDPYTDSKTCLCMSHAACTVRHPLTAPLLILSWLLCLRLACPARQYTTSFRGGHGSPRTDTHPAGAAQVQHRYFLLVILTTSTGADLEEFRAALTGAAGELALSVIVVGIGSIDFVPLKAWPSSPAYLGLELEQVEDQQQL